MARFTCIIVCFFSSFLLLSAQSQKNTDSLIKLVEHTTDTSKYALYKEIYIQLKDINADSALPFIEQALAFSIKEKNLKQQAYFLTAKGNLYAHKGELDQSIMLFERAKEIALMNNDTIFAIRCMNNMGAIITDLADFNRASYTLFEALRLAEKYDLADIESKILTNIGTLFISQKEWEKSIEYFYLAINKNAEINNLKGIALLYNNIGISYYFLDVLDSVLVSFERSLNIYIELNDKKGQTRPLFNIGEIYAQKEDYNKALEYYKKSMAIEKEIGYKIGYANSMVYIGVIYAEIGEYILALENQRKGISLLKEINAPNELKDAYFSIHETFLKINKPDSALAYFKKMSELNDSLFTLEKSQQIAELETIYQTEKKENEILVLEKEKEKAKNFRIILLSAIAGLVMLTGFLVTYLKLYAKTSVERALALEQKKQFNAVLTAQEEERKRLARELHDNVGPLLSLSQLYISELTDSKEIKKEDDIDLLQKSHDIIKEASDETRNISHNLMPGVLVQLGLIPAIRELLNKLNSAKKFTLNFDSNEIKERFEETIEITYYRILQELLNNIIKHAEATQITVRVEKDNSQLILAVEDNGKGFDTAIVKEASGIGWKNINSRLLLISGKVLVDSSNQGTSVKIISPLSQQ